jgi:hypothetical protein
LTTEIRSKTKMHAKIFCYSSDDQFGKVGASKQCRLINEESSGVECRPRHCTCPVWLSVLTDMGPISPRRCCWGRSLRSQMSCKISTFITADYHLGGGAMKQTKLSLYTNRNGSLIIFSSRARRTNKPTTTGHGGCEI